MKEEWGPVIYHDGLEDSRPKVGMIVRIKNRRGEVITFQRGCGLIIGGPRTGQKSTSDRGRNIWNWKTFLPHLSDVISYQIKKPKGLQVLEKLLNNLPKAASPVKALEGLLEHQ